MSVKTGTQISSTEESLKQPEVVIRIQNLVKRYGHITAVNGLDLRVQSGEIFGFLGPNGAGKTTTIRMILGLINPSHGNIEVLGYDVAKHRTKVLPRVGALIETPALHLYMSGRDNLKSFGYILGGVSDARIDEVLDIVKLGARKKDRVKTYSLGMKQRLGLAIALLNDPDLLILDEPANGLDPAGIVEMRDLLRNLASAGKTIFISSHVLTEVQQICTRVAILNKGKLVTESTIDDLIHGHGEFIVRVENAEQALSLIKSQSWGQSAHMDGSGAIITVAPENRGRNLTKLLVDAGFIPDEIAYQSENLEQVFLRLTGSTFGGNE